MKHLKLIVLSLFLFPLFLNAQLVGTQKVRIGQEILLSVPTEYRGYDKNTWGWEWYCLNDGYVKFRSAGNTYQRYVTLTEACRNVKEVKVYFEYKYSEYGHEFLTVLRWVLEIEENDDYIEINVTNFPDEFFRNYLLSQSYGKDGKLTKSEISNVKEIKVYSNHISSLKGIEYFTALTRLICFDNQLTSLDVSKNTSLTELYCQWNQLTSLDVSKNKALTTFSCYTNQLTTLDISNNTALALLRCFSNKLTSLDVSKNTALTNLECDDNKLTSLDVSKNIALTLLFCHSNELTSLDVSKNIALTYLSCDDNKLSSLDVSKNTALTELHCDENELTSLDVTKNTVLEYLLCSTNQLTSLDVSKCTKLQKLVFYGNNIKGASMDNLISSIPKNNTNDIHYFCVVSKDKNEENVCTKDQIAAVKAKGWFPCYYYNYKYLEYKAIDAVSIALPETATVAENSTITLTPQLTPSNATTQLTWSSDDETVATVNSDGVVTGVKEGMTFIVVTTDNGLEAFCELTVTKGVAPEPTNITIPDKLSISVGQRLKIDYTLTPENAETTVTWTISKDIASIDADGFITGKAEGLAVLKATTANGITSNSCRVTVTPATEIKGDVNGDHSVDVADISAIITVMSGLDDGSRRPFADVNGDGAIDVADISRVIFIMAELSRCQQLLIE